MSDFSKQYAQAFFKNVPFFVRAHDFSGGRNAALYTYPTKDTPRTDDLGRAGRVFQVEAYVIGDDVFVQRNNLLDALESFGPGILSHPYMGDRRVQVGPFTLHEEALENRIAYFSITFFESDEQKFPIVVADKTTKTDKIVAALKAASTAAFVSVFKTIGQVQGVVDSAQARILDASNIFDAATTGLTGTVLGLDNVSYGIRNLRRDVNILAADPSILASRFVTVIEDLTGMGVADETSLQAANKINTFGNLFPFVPQRTNSQVQIYKNQTALKDFVRQIVIAQVVSLSVKILWESLDKAIFQRDQVVALIESQLEIIQDENVFRELSNLKSIVTEFVPDQTQELPKIREFTLNASLPFFVVLYDLFESLDQEQNFILRNKIRHPGFVPGGVALEVLSE